MPKKNAWDSLPDYSPSNVPAQPSGKKAEWDSLPDYDPTPKADVAGAAQAGLEHFGNAASMGYMPQVQGFVSQLMPDPSADVDAKLREQGFKIDQKSPTYISERDAYIKHLEQQEKDHPVASTVGTVGGALASGIATSGLTPINAAGRMGRVWQAAKGGAAIGAVSNPGDKEGQLTGFQAGDRVNNAITGGILGGAGQGVVEGLSATAKGVMSLPAGLQSTGEERAFKSSGAMLKDYRKANDKGMVNKLGRFMIDEGMTAPGSTFDDVAAKSGAIKDEAGKVIADTYAKANAAVSSPEVMNSLSPAQQKSLLATEFRPAEFADEFEKSLKSEFKGTAGFNKALPQVQSVLTDIREIGDNANILQLQKAKVDVQNLVNYDKAIRDEPLAKQLLAKLRTDLSSKIDARLTALDSALGSNSLAPLKEANQRYALSSELHGISSDRVSRESANNFMSLGDKITGSAGMAAGFASGDGLEDRFKKAAVGASLGLGTKALRKYGVPIVSNAMDSAGRALGRTYLGELGEAAAPALKAMEQSPVSTANTVGVMSRPQLERAPQLKVAEDESKQNRKPSEALRGEAKWAQDGAQKLGVDPSLASDPKLRKLLIEASDLKPGSKRYQSIKNQLQGNK